MREKSESMLIFWRRSESAFGLLKWSVISENLEQIFPWFLQNNKEAKHFKNHIGASKIYMLCFKASL
jgi:hypothetical protein